MSSKISYRYLIPFALAILAIIWLILDGKKTSDGEATTPALGQAYQTPFSPTDNDKDDAAGENPDYLVLSAGAYHFDNFNERNAFTPGIGWEYSPSSKVGWHAGTLSDSFGYQALYAGINYATKPVFYGKVRFLLGATAVHKQYKKNAEPETKLLPIPAVEIKLTKRSVLNLSGSPQVDYGDHHNNAVLFFQFKLNVD